MPVEPCCEQQDVFCAAVENIVENGAEDFVGFARAGAVGKKDARAHQFFTGIFLIDGQMAGMSLSGGNDEFELCIRNEAAADDPRSEEHTSELQSLMRISYAVFCLIKKTINQR